MPQHTQRHSKDIYPVTTNLLAEGEFGTIHEHSGLF
jgi:hypothetical protein